MSTFLIYDGIIKTAPPRYLANIDSGPTPTDPISPNLVLDQHIDTLSIPNLVLDQHIDTLSGIGAKRLREVISITVPVYSNSHLLVHWLPFFHLPYLYHLCAIARLNLKSLFPVDVVDIIMLKYFKGLNELLNESSSARQFFHYPM